jgi:hypothetical protein
MRETQTADAGAMSRRPRSRAGLVCAVAAVALLVLAPVMLMLDSGTGFWVFATLGFVVGVVALGVTAIELLAGYRGRPQVASLALVALLCSVVVLFVAWVASGGTGT